MDQFFVPNSATNTDNNSGGAGVVELVARIEEALGLVRTAQEKAAIKKQKTNPYSSQLNLNHGGKRVHTTDESESEQYWMGAHEFDD